MEVLHILFRWQEAHEVIVKEIAPEAVIGQEYDYLHRYFVRLEQPGSLVCIC